ncbi:MAG: hypothetical protein H0U23_03405 [Blastocatellia bacterium]|nr:hypothetical protein [Blastocatellia bacterium]
MEQGRSGCNIFGGCSGNKTISVPINVEGDVEMSSAQEINHRTVSRLPTEERIQLAALIL